MYGRPQIKRNEVSSMQDAVCTIQDSLFMRFYIYRASFYFNFSSLILISWFGLFLVIHLLGFPSDKVLEHLPIICPFKTLTGISCPGCGMTRAFLALGEADFVGAFHLNPFSIPLFAFFVFSAFKIQLPIPQRVNNYLPSLCFIVIILWWFWTRLAPGVFISILL